MNLREENRKLLEENKNLRDLTKNAYWKISHTSTQKKDSSFSQSFSFQQAQVVDLSIQKEVNYIMINKGANHGIKPEMGVMHADGVVGVVKDVSANFSTIISLLNKDRFSVLGALQTKGYTGRVSWQPYDAKKLKLYEVPQSSPIKKGDLITTGFASTVFPSGVAIGVVDSIRAQSGELFYDIDLKTSVDFLKLSYVYIIENLQKQEQDSLREAFNQTYTQ